MKFQIASFSSLGVFALLTSVGFAAVEDRPDLVPAAPFVPPEPSPLIQENSPGRYPTPPGAHIRLEADSFEYVIGERVTLRLILENQGEEPFVAEINNRGIRARAWDSNGEFVPQSHSIQIFGSGFTHAAEIKPGESKTTQTTLHEHGLISSPGTYTIRATDDYGWATSIHPHPIGEIELTFREPTPSEAAQIVHQILSQPKSESDQYTLAANSLWNLSRLRSAHYLPALIQQVSEGVAEALHGISAIETPEATEALLRFTASDHQAVRNLAARLLLNRLPVASEAKSEAHPNVKNPTDRRRIAASSWLPGFAPRVRSLAETLIQTDGPESLETAAFIYGSLGQRRDGETVQLAITELLKNPSESIEFHAFFPGVYSGPLRALLQATDQFISLGLLQIDPSQSETDVLIRLNQIERHPQQQFDDRVALCLEYGMSENPVIRQAVQRALPQKAPSMLWPIIEAGLNDSDLGIRRRAAFAASTTGNQAFLDSLFGMLENETQLWSISAVKNAIDNLGGRDFETAQSWLTRIDDPAFNKIALDSLCEWIDIPHTLHGNMVELSAEEREEIHRAWEEFLEINEAQIRRGERITHDDPSVSYRLFGRGKIWSKPDGSIWPARP